MQTLERHLERVLTHPFLRGARFTTEVFRGSRIDSCVVLVRGDRDDITLLAGTATEILRYSEPDWKLDGMVIDYRFMATDALAA
jgi:hypothetical protein